VSEETAADSAAGLFDIVHELGRGSMGVVWLARERALDRLVALKVPAPGASPEWSARFLREGKAAASMRHPNIVAVHSMGGEGTTAFLAMEFIEGGGLDERVANGPLPPRQAAEIVAQVAGALAYAHGAGLLHRDIKPSNILMDEEGQPHLADFGLAGPLAGGGDLTIPGHIAGTPAYLAPELLRGSEKASPASDVYGLGAVLYSCLTGRAPFLGESVGAVLAQVPVADPPPPHLLAPGIPRDLETICSKCLEKSPDRRYGSAALLQSDLTAFLEGRPIAARPLGWSGKLARSCRRHPTLAVSITATFVCLLALAIGGPLMAFRLGRAQDAAQDRLREALLARSRATRLAAQIGQRDDALSAAEEASKIRPGLDARDEAIAALARPEVIPIRSWHIKRYTDGVMGSDPDNDRYVYELAPGMLEMHSLADDHLIHAWTGPAERLWTYPMFSSSGRKVVARNSASVLVWDQGRTGPDFELKDRPYVLAGRFEGYGQPDALSPDGTILASALADAGVSLNSTVDGHEMSRLPTDVAATHVAFSNDGKMVAVGRGLLSHDGRVVAFIHVFDVATGKRVSRLRIDKGFQSLIWSPDDSRILISGDRLDLFAVSDGTLLRSLNDPQAVRGFFGPNGATLMSSTQSGTITLWDLGSARPLLTGGLGSRVEIAVSRAGDRIVKADGDSVARLVRLEMSGVERTWAATPSSARDNVLSAAVSTADYSPDGKWLATAIWGGIQLRGRDGSLLASENLGTLSNYCSVRFSRDGRSLLAGTAEEGLVRLPITVREGADPILGTPEFIDREEPEYITDVSPDGARALVTSFTSGFVKVIALDGGPGAVRWALPGAAGASFLKGGRQVLANSLDAQGGAKMEVRDAADGRVERSLPYPYGAHVNLSADGSTVVLGTGADGTVLLHGPDLSQGAALPVDVRGRDFQCAISPDGRIAAFGVGVQAWLVNTEDGSVLAHLQAAQGGSYMPGLAFSPDGSRLALWWETGQLTVWNLEQLRKELRSRGLDW